MPLRSKAQQRWMFANKPEMAKEWAAETPDIGKLPERVGDTYGLKPRKKGGKTREKLHAMKLEGK